MEIAIKVKRQRIVTEMVTVKSARESFFEKGSSFVGYRRKFKLKILDCAICSKSLDVDTPITLIIVEGHTNQLAHDKCFKEVTDET